MALEQPIWMQQSVDDPTITYTGQQLRVLTDVMSFLAGVTLKTDLAVSQRASGANMSVDVAAGSCIVAGGTIAYQGKYVCRSTSVQNVAIAAPPGSGTRTDLVIARVYDNQADGLSQYKWQPEVITGTVGAGVPSLASSSYIPLAQVTVGAGVPSIVNSNLTDARLLNTLGDIPVWEVSGGNGQPIPSATVTPYSGWTVSDSIGMTSVSTSAGVTVALPGRYSTSFSGRIDTNGAASYRQVFLRLIRGGTVIKNVPNSVVSSATAGADLAITQPPMSVSTTFRCQPGDVIQAFYYQTSGATLHVADAFSENNFSGAWIGP